ncbi:MAG TPA: rhodanese-like domain-containing protein, partial [Chitinophagaceae bacterium]|nr:rhodanese-like domain-containing protein [Chitinophagaceae bacterium]
FETEHINGAKNIPVNEIQFRLDEIKKLSQPIVVYCLSGGRSAMAASILKQAGISEVYNGGGIGNMKQILFN